MLGSRRAYLIAGACVAMSAAPAVAQVGRFGSAQNSTYRSCQGATANELCIANADGSGNASAILQQVYGGGLGQFGSANLEIDRAGTVNDAYARSTVSQGTLLLPQISGATLAGSDDRMNINAFGFQSYTWTGQTASLFSLAGNLHIVDSGRQDQIIEQRAGDWARVGGARAESYVAVWDPSILAGFTTAQDLIDNLLFAACGQAGVLGVGRQNITLRGGEFSSSVATTECSEGSLIVQPGQEVLAVSGLRLPTNRGGFVDATHTFTTVLDPSLSQQTRDALASGLVAAVEVPAVPEPATWAMLVVGFGLMAGAARYRRRSLKVSLA